MKSMKMNMKKRMLRNKANTKKMKSRKSMRSNQGVSMMI